LQKYLLTDRGRYIKIGVLKLFFRVCISKVDFDRFYCARRLLSIYIFDIIY
jgi:hypothetical protein